MTTEIEKLLEKLKLYKDPEALESLEEIEERPSPDVTTDQLKEIDKILDLVSLKYWSLAMF